MAFIELLGLRRVAGLMCKFIHMQIGKRKYTHIANIYSQIQIYEGNIILYFMIFIGPRYTWGPIYGSKSVSQTLVDLTDVSLVDEDTNSILADDTNRAIPCNLEV